MVAGNLVELLRQCAVCTPPRRPPESAGAVRSLYAPNNPRVTRWGAGQARKPCPNGKVFSNLCAYLCEDASITPRVPEGAPPPVDSVTAEALTVCLRAPPVPLPLLWPSPRVRSDRLDNLRGLQMFSMYYCYICIMYWG